MPFPFTLPTTSSVLLSDNFTSHTHPSLTLTATTRRSVLKDSLKRYKRLPPSARASQLPAVQNALTNYLPYLLALHTASGYRDVNDEQIDVEIPTPLTTEWRSTLSATLPGREPARPKLTGLHHEIAFVISTLAYVHSLLARNQLQLLHTTLTPDQRVAAITFAMKHLLEAHSIHMYLLTLPSSTADKTAPIDIQASTISALAALALAEATLIVVSKDDPYLSAVAEDRDESNKDWMFKAPTIPKVRAHLFARICLAAADHASQASGLLTRGSSDDSGKIDEDLVKYADNLRRTARGKAARFLAIDTELSGKTGEGLAWLKGARKELGMAVELEDGKRKGFRGLKQNWQERREDRKTATGKGDWGLDAGRLEETRVVEMLETKWERENSTVNVQLVPAWEPLLASMPTGREYHSPKKWTPPVLGKEELATMRAPIEEGQRGFGGEEDDSGDEGRWSRGEPVGAFPGTKADYGAGMSGDGGRVYY